MGIITIIHNQNKLYDTRESYNEENKYVKIKM
jgi:hypothetical protein